MINTKFKQTEIGEIPQEWSVLTVNDIKAEGRSVISGPFGSNIGSRFFVNEGVPVIRGNNLTTDGVVKFIDEGFVFLTETKAQELKSYAHRSDVVFTAAGTLGQVGYIDESSKFENYVISNKQLRLTLDTNKVLPLYAYYWFSSRYMCMYINSRNTGSTIPLINLSVLKSLPIPVPSINEQSKIISIISSIDDKIELNNKIIKNLENISQTIFKRWFIDYEFPNEKGEPYKSSGGEMIDSELGEIPKGWSVSNLESIGTFLNGLALQKYPKNGEEFLYAIKIRELNNGITENTDKVGVNLPKEYIVVDGDLLFSWSGSLDIVIWGEGKGALNQHLFKVTSSTYPKWFMYNWIKQFIPFFQMIASSKATTMGHIQRKHLAEALVSIPPQEIINNADKLIGPLFNSIIEYKQEIQTLIKTKDLLLPKLLSGKIRIN